MGIIPEPLARDLFYVSDKGPGLRRFRRGRGFVYLDHGLKVNDKNTLKRINELKIPPNWRNVWICNFENGYLQATGFDAKGRKQYLYHKEWICYQQETKFEKLAEFAKLLPVIRGVNDRNLKKQGWPKEKVLALIVSILDSNFMRIGNSFYREENSTYGLTTLRRKHLEINNGTVIFSYKGKSNVYQTIRIENKKFTRLIKQCSELPGYEVFRYINGDGKSSPVTSKDINDYLEQISGTRFTSKTFRTWGATVLAIKKYKEACEEVNSNKRITFKKTLIKKVACELGNTVSVCEEYYIHPRVLNYLLQQYIHEQDVPAADLISGIDEEEAIALKILTI
jgi:DNA topoisomerase I